MLKACWDCINGYNDNRARRENGDAYGIQLNGAGSQNAAPQWPSTSYKNENMFVLPRALNVGDKVHVYGRISSDPQSITINLLTGYSGPDSGNIACQVESMFPASGQDKVTVRIIENGYPQEISGDHEGIPASDFFTSSDFSFSFSVSLNNYQSVPRLSIHMGDNFLSEFNLKHSIDQIRFLSVYGDVEKITALNFVFG